MQQICVPGNIRRNNPYSTKGFLIKLVTSSPFPIRLTQTDNKPVFTNAFMVKVLKYKSLFEKALDKREYCVKDLNGNIVLQWEGRMTTSLQ